MQRQVVAGVILVLMLGVRTSAPGSDIHKAVSDGDLAKVKALTASAPASVSEADGNGATPLQTAIAKGQNDIASFLVLETPCVFGESFLISRFAEGQRALKTGLLQKAHVLFLRLVKENPKHDRASFALGLTSCSLGELAGAQMLFRRALEINPGNHRARAELARVLVLQHQPEQAETELNKAFDHHMTAEDRGNIERFLEEIRKGSSRGYFSGRLDVGYIDDDNVNVGPESEFIGTVPIIYGSDVITSLTVPEGSQPASARGGFVALGATGFYDVGVRKAWVVGVEAAYYENWLGEHPDNETQFLQLGAGLQYVGRQGAVYIPLVGSYITYGQEPLVLLYGLNPVWVVGAQAEGSLQWITKGALQWRDYDELDDRDGAYVAVGETVRQCFGERGHTLDMGLTAFLESADAAIYENSGLTWSLRATIQLPARMSLYGQTSYTTADYREREPLAPEKRSDTVQQYQVGADVRIVDGLGIDVSVQHVDHDSTFALYQYERNVVTVSTYLVF